LGERAYIDPREAEKLRSGIHTQEEIRDKIKEKNMIEEEHQKDKAERIEKLERKIKPMNPQIKELQERQLDPDKLLTKEQREERDRESI